MSQLVTIFGGSGFLGRYVARRMAQKGWRVRVATRRVNEAMFVRPYGAVGQVEPVFCNVRDDASVRAATAGADAVVHCVGTFDAKGKNSFDAIHVEATDRIAKIAAQEGVARLVHISAIGADAQSKSEYSRTKAAGEMAVLKHMPNAMILRPSVMFGTEDAFFNRFASMARTSPVLPVVGAQTEFQPAYVDDVAAAAVLGVTGSASGTYELGGPDRETFRALMQQMLTVVHRRRLILNIPFWAGRIIAWFGGIGQSLSLGIIKAPITADQVQSLAYDNVVSQDTKGFADLGIQPVSMEAVLPDYLWRFRPSGQYSAIKNSAKNLKV